MSVTPIKDAANLEYTGLYIPIASWFYLYQQNPGQTKLVILGTVLIGAVITHSMLRSIFGFEGPRQKPKNSMTVVGYIFALMYTKTPGANPDTVQELRNRVENAFTLRRGLRFLIMFTLTVSYFILTFYSLIPLFELVDETGDTVAGVLFLLQTIFILQGVIMRRTPAIVPPEQVKWIYVPEYRRIQEEFSEDEYEDSDYVDPPMILEEVSRQIKEAKYEHKAKAMMTELDYEPRQNRGSND